MLFYHFILLSPFFYLQKYLFFISYLIVTQSVLSLLRKYVINKYKQTRYYIISHIKLSLNNERTDLMKRFSKKELFEIRNFIPIQDLMKDLQIPSIIENDIFRFLCPICNGYNTSIKYDTNLARCFNCNENFNTIEIAMKIRKTGFVDNIKFLKQYISDHQTNSKQMLSNESSHSKYKCQTGAEKKIQHRSNSDLIHIGKILQQSIIKNDQNNHSDSKFNWSEYCRANDRRISIIEQKIEIILIELQNNK